MARADAEPQLVAAASVIATASAPDQRVAEQLSTCTATLHLIGDARATGGIEGAMADAGRVALAID